MTPKLKIKWKAAPAAAGRFRSFQGRAWPSATHADGRTAAYIRCPGVDYTPAHGRDEFCGNTIELLVLVADYRGEGDGFVWRQLKARASKLSEAKALAEGFLARNRPFWDV